MKDTIKLRGYIELEIRSVFDNSVVRREKHNIIVTAGRRWVLQQIASSEIQTAQSISHMAVGTGTAAPATSDTGLQNEASRKGIGTFTTTNLTSNPPSWRAEVSWATNEANTTIGEAGLFNSSSGGTMLGRATFSTLNKTTSNTMSISYTVQN